ncbi:MAG: 5-bromo-4-chloroindolyl phosphate hydrolysis family protein [Alphaproteobacteria bacterium]|nr:5-bromo-4-chloroindolyl phosphate hydrolysis family protein [Alphaproteobacteria bacterium]
MGRRWRRDAEEFRSFAYEAARAARAAGDVLSANSGVDLDAVERAREERRAARVERRRQAMQRQLATVGVGLLVGGLVASMGVFTPAAVGAGLVAAVFAGAILRWLGDVAGRFSGPAAPQPTRIETPRVDTVGMADARADLVRKVLDEATADLRRLDAAAAKLADGEARTIAQRLVQAGGRLAQAVAAAPDKFALAQRAFTYHLPKAVYLAETLGSLDAAGADEKRRAAARHVLARMENLFEKTALDLANVDAREMDVELRLINQALDEDLDRTTAPKA